uniref:Nucleoside-triphosphate pyrophosphatase n=2 Tax=Candidatus Bipolaricaulota TaxID=67810 RepID=H5SMM1_9BACT|nr:nucleoside-triphosphate pyrophosphatase [uncultured Acetothermia bacterium]BAL59789.1 nucleoside-triphosphate pyrophosphatase [Candidatus Acetothermum autotrophicum]
MERAELELRSLVELVAHLRSERGCPWDRAQTHESLKHLLIEEAYETVAAIESGNKTELKDELGDLLLHVAFHVQIAQEHKEFTLQDVLQNIYEKIVRRHPHVFGAESSQDIEQIKGRWEEIKRREGKGFAATALPALIEARKLQERAAQAHKELAVRPSKSIAALLREPSEERLGELLFEIVALARQLQLDPEVALKRTTAQFAQKIESLLANYDRPE